jgi:hypothetical protein
MQSILQTILIVFIVYMFINNFIIGAICMIPAVMVYTLLDELLTDFNNYLNTKKGNC